MSLGNNFLLTLELVFLMSVNPIIVNYVAGHTVPTLCSSATTG